MDISWTNTSIQIVGAVIATYAAITAKQSAKRTHQFAVIQTRQELVLRERLPTYSGTLQWLMRIRAEIERFDLRAIDAKQELVRIERVWKDGWDVDAYPVRIALFGTPAVDDLIWKNAQMNVQHWLIDVNNYLISGPDRSEAKEIQETKRSIVDATTELISVMRKDLDTQLS